MNNTLKGVLKYKSNSTLKGHLVYKGVRGDSAYEIAVKNGFKGNEEAWLKQIGFEEISAKLPANVKDFGVVGDGVTDDTEALTNCINYCHENDCVMVSPSCTIALKTTLTSDKNIYWIGHNTKLITLDGSIVCDFRESKNLYLKGLTADPYMRLLTYGEDMDKVEPNRNVRFEDINFLDAEHEPINFKLYLSTKRPETYDDNNGGAYSQYPLEIVNYTGYNALMITNKSVDENGEICNGGADNSAVGIIDQVKGVASPTILVSGGYRHIFRATGNGNENLLNIAMDGRIGIGCSTDDDDENIPGVAVFKVFYPNPSAVIKDSETGNKLSASISGANLNVQYRDADILIGNPTDGYKLATLKNGANNGLTFKNGQIFVDSNNRMALSYWNYIDDEANGRLIQCSYSCATSERPTNLTDTDKDRGFMIFDRNLNKPIWWNGTKWVDATGTSV